MSTDHHTAIAVGAAANAATFNAPLGQLDAVLGTLNDTVTNAVTGVYNVLDYGATGDGSTDDTAAIQAAINACDDTGGVVYFPLGNYSINATLTINTKRGVRLSGVMQSYAIPGSSLGSTLKWAGSTSDDMLYIFNSQDIRVDGLCFDGADTTGSRAIFVDSNNTQPSKRMHIDHCFFRRSNIGIQFSTGEAGYQVDSDYISNCAFFEMYGTSSTCIRVESTNTSYLNIENCEMFYTKYGLRVIRGAPTRMCNVTGGGDESMKFVSIEGPISTLNMTNCQAESLAYFLHVTSDAPAQTTPLVLIQCIIDAPIQIDDRARITSIGCQFNYGVTLAGNDCEWASIFDYWGSGIVITKSGINCRAYYLDGSSGLNLDGSFILRHLSATTTWDPGSIPAGGYNDAYVTVTGAVAGDTCTADLSSLIVGGALLYATIASNNVAVVTLMNNTSGALAPGSGTLRVDVWKH